MTQRIASELYLPQLGEGLREARIVRLICGAGSSFRRGDPLYAVETDKTTVELEAPRDGVLLEWQIGVGDVVAIDAPVASILTDESAVDRHGRPAIRHEPLIPPRTREYARTRGIDGNILGTIPAMGQKLMPADVDAYLLRQHATVPERVNYKESLVDRDQRALVFRLRRSAGLVIPGTIVCEFVWAALERLSSRLDGLRCSPFQAFGHIVAMTTLRHPRFRSVMLNDDTVRDYENVNIGFAVSRGGDELSVAVVRAADTLDLAGYVRACRAQMRSVIKGCIDASDDAQIILSHLGKFRIQDAIPTLVAPANAVIFLGSPDRGTGLSKVSLTFDHRLINGAGAARFLRDVAEEIERSGSNLIPLAGCADPASGRPPGA